mgnify:CR=1 FL=1
MVVGDSDEPEHKRKKSEEESPSKSRSQLEVSAKGWYCLTFLLYQCRPCLFANQVTLEPFHKLYTIIFSNHYFNVLEVSTLNAEITSVRLFITAAYLTDHPTH